MRQHKLPLVMGVAMGLMMMAMLHSALTSQSTIGAAALVGFIAIHVLFVVLAGGLAFLATRMSAKWRARLARVHMPSRTHIAAMVLSAGATGLGLHIALHGGLV